jgi:hypothetical protein
MKELRWPSIAFLVAASCQQGGSDQLRSSSGIVDVQVQESASALHVAGLDSQGVEVKAISVRKTDLGREVTVLGRGMKILQHDPSEEREDEGLRLPVVSPELKAFFTDDRVAAPLSRWGVFFNGTMNPPRDSPAPHDKGETAYGQSCSFGAPSTCGSYTCCEWEGETNPEEWLCCGNATLNDRRCVAACISGGSNISCSDVSQCPSGCNSSCANGFCHDTSNGCGSTGQNGCSPACWTEYFSHCQAVSNGYPSCAANACQDPGSYCDDIAYICCFAGAPEGGTPGTCQSNVCVAD